MVKVGILGAHNPVAGEIIRILVNHPETEITTLFSLDRVGHNVAYIHHGLIGESPLYFTDKIDLEDIDFLILIERSEISDKVLYQIQQNHKSEDDKSQKVVAVDKKIFDGIVEGKIPEEKGPSNDEADINTPKEGFAEIGLSEINRKALVRGAEWAYIPSVAIVPALIALAPLANFLLLNSDLEITVSVPLDIYKEIDHDEILNQLKKQLKYRQNSLACNVSLKIIPNETQRDVDTVIKMQNSLPLEEIEKIYGQTYDDHNFTFISNFPVNSKEVAGTQKVVINLDKPDTNSLEIHLVADARMRGGAGDVVHVMNLFFGLHEKTGLQLKSSNF